MTIAWGEFVLVAVVSLVSASLLVAAYSLALRVRYGDGTLRRVASNALFVVCGLIVLFGIYLIVPFFHR